MRSMKADTIGGGGGPPSIAMEDRVGYRVSSRANFRASERATHNIVCKLPILLTKYKFLLYLELSI